MATVSGSVYDVLGRRITTLVDSASFVPGDHEIGWDGRNENGATVASGVYLLELRAGPYRMIERVVVVR